jgi:phosphoglycolate phosphatase-like HAD superfamily hydrolase
MLSPLRLRVGFDVDEVLDPWVGSLRHYLDTVEGWTLERMPDPTAYEFWASWGTTSRDEFDELAAAAARSGILHGGGAPVPGADDVTGRLPAAGHEAHIITARGRGHGGGSWTRPPSRT